LLVFRELKENLLESSCLALGVFDGVHLGHQKVILNAVKKAQELGNTSAVVTFSKHPRFVISKSNPDIITSIEERLELFENLGVQAAVVLDFDEKLASMTAKEYLKNILIGCLNAKSITIGYNHKFGQQSCKLRQPDSCTKYFDKNEGKQSCKLRQPDSCTKYFDKNEGKQSCKLRQPDSCTKYFDKNEDNKPGNGKFLENYSKKHGYEVSIISPVKIDSHVVSSSVIRKFILKGDVETAAKFLGRSFKIKGTVIHGQHLGRTLGFPTANLLLPDDLIIPLNGVYSGLVKIDAKVYHAVINIGKRPTIGDLKKDLVEAHILDFDEDIYGKIIEISFLERIRNEIKFNSLEELKIQIKKDCDFIK